MTTTKPWPENEPHQRITLTRWPIYQGDLAILHEHGYWFVGLIHLHKAVGHDDGALTDATRVDGFIITLMSSRTDYDGGRGAWGEGHRGIAFNFEGAPVALGEVPDVTIANNRGSARRPPRS